MKVKSKSDLINFFQQKMNPVYARLSHVKSPTWISRWVELGAI